ncbi:hypothetical protein [Sphingomonas azotifigens]|uniref:hypothetical protein n=1 Tax=Sphingomonas azotifigens TaxID=330920 RepID=UPI00111C91F7|nr:hypothetical protein [Sphingomonas azotifigens]
MDWSGAAGAEFRILVGSGHTGLRLDHHQSCRYFFLMDFSGLIALPLAAVITACWIVGASIFSRRGPGFRAPFLLSCAIGVIFMEPWRIGAWQELGMFAIMLAMLTFSVAIGCIVGGIPAAAIVSLAPKLRRRFGR